jgi:hypothetical protein
MVHYRPFPFSNHYTGVLPMIALLPNMRPQPDLTYGPLFFLAGPVDGGDGWQTNFCTESRRHMECFYAAIPCRYPKDHPFRSLQLHDLCETQHQLDWENYYLELAATKGCLVFWLPLESRTNPRRSRGPYAMNTMRELGAWSVELRHRPELRIVIGAHPDFPGLSEHRRQFSLATGSQFPIHYTMEDAVLAAIAKATAK